MSLLAQQRERQRMHLAARLAAGAEARETAGAAVIEDCLGEDAAGAVAGAEKQDVDHFALIIGLWGRSTRRPSPPAPALRRAAHWCHRPCSRRSYGTLPTTRRRDRRSSSS